MYPVVLLAMYLPIFQLNGLVGKWPLPPKWWPRDWYNQALENPQIKVTLDGVTADYVAVPLSDVEHEQVRSENANGVGLHFLFGFAPRKFLRLDPITGDNFWHLKSY